MYSEDKTVFSKCLYDRNNYSWGRVLAELLRKIFGSKRGMATADDRKLHTEELHGLYSSTNKCSNK
jgi:hypothetical protein